MGKLRDWQLFAICVLVWGTTWYAITWQVGPVAPEVGVALRFAVAGLLVLGIAASNGQRLRFGVRAHGYLAMAGSVLTFACYLTLQDRIGPGPAGTIGVMTPLLALAVSMVFEAYRPDAITAVGALLAIAGNSLMLTPPAPVRRVAAATE